MTDDNVIQFTIAPPKTEQLPVTIKKRDYGERCCTDTHVNMEADPETQLLTCKDCGKIMCAWNWLIAYAHRDLHIDFRYNELKAKATQTAAELAEIERQLANAKARLRRWNP